MLLRAHVVSRTASFHDFTPVLQQLYWLPVKFKINLKLLLYTFKATHNLAPPCPSNLLHMSQSLFVFVFKIDCFLIVVVLCFVFIVVQGL